MRMTNQEAFDKIVQWFFVDMNRSSVDAKPPEYGGGCMYRGPDGTKCAIGCIMSDADYDPEWEGKRVTAIDGPRRWVKEQGLDLSFMRKLQSAHDDHAGFSSGRFRSNMAYDLKKAAIEFTGGSISIEKLEAATR